MARIEDLLDRITDEPLRRELQAAVRELKRSQRFGLVFEEHIPETVALPGLPVQVGSLSHLRTDIGGKQLLRVLDVTGTVATVESTEGRRKMEVPLENLLVVKRFGEPIYPGLSSVGSELCGDPSGPHHVVINGENYHVLELLCYAVEGAVDCIYIDPPYNTGARDWKYNNRYVDSRDRWHHSKWLSFMQKRLRLARRLLKKDGVLIVTIDEHEVHHLGMLLERVFPDYLRYTVTIVHNPKGTYKANFARVDEYALFCVPERGAGGAKDVIEALPEGLFAQAGRPAEMEGLFDKDEELLYLRRRGQESGYREQRPNQFYAILVDEDQRKVVGVGPELSVRDSYAVSREGSVVTVYPLDSRNKERVWRYSRETMNKYIAAGDIVVTSFSKRTGQGWVLHHRVQRRRTKRVKTVWWEKRHDAGTHGSDLLTQYLGEPGLFPFPKSVYAVRDCLDAVVRNRPDALIVDFFAGSGTTLHSVSLLNEADGGRRRCVMVTNNEVDEKSARKLAKAGRFAGDPEFERHGIFERVTVPRSRAVLTGRRPDGEAVEGGHVWAGRRPYSAGFEENVEFLRLEYLDPDDVDLGRQFDAVHPLLWLSAGAIGQRVQVGSEDEYLVESDLPYGILFRESAFRAFRARLRERPNVTHVWLVTDSEEAFLEMRAALPRTLEVSMLYRDYLRTFQVNTGSSQ